MKLGTKIKIKLGSVFAVILYVLLFWAPVLASDSGYQRCEPATDCTIGEYIFEDDGHTPVTTDNFCQITIADPSDAIVVNAAYMNHKSDGWYYYNANISSPQGMYRAKMCCSMGNSDEQCIDKTFIIGTTLDTVATKSDLAGLVEQIWSYTGGRTLTAFGSLAADVWDNTFAPIRKLSDATLTGGGILATASDVSNSNDEILAAVNTRASQDSVDTIRDSQQRQWSVYLSDMSDVSKGDTYRAKLWVLNYESTPTDAASLPTVTIYDPVRNISVQNVAMAKLSTGIYEYTFNVSTSAIQGTWETEVSATVESGKTIKTSDYWDVAGSPAQIKINSITDLTIPDVSANITLTNEGTTDYEYQYQWCVVSSQDNVCGGGDDIYYASAAKLVKTGQDWVTDLTATVPNAGNYWFKVVVYYGTAQSGASQSFIAIKPSSGGGGGGGDGGGTTTYVNGIVSLAKSLGADQTSFCKIFPCDIIDKILVRLDNLEKFNTAADQRMTALEARISRISTTAPTPLVYQKKATAPAAATITRARVRIQLESS